MADATIKVSILADSKDFNRGMDSATKKTETTGQKFGSFAKVAVAALAVAALAAVKAFVDDSIRAFSALEQSVGGTEAVFGDSSKVIDDFAKDSAKNIGLSEAAFRDATTAIGGQLKRMTGDVDFAAEQSVHLTQVAADLAATYGGTTAQAVEALGSAFRGEADPAERFNLDLKIGRVNAKALELGLAKTTGEIDDNARAQAILALITEQGADAQGQFAEEADTVGVKMQKNAAIMEDHKAILGEVAAEYGTLMGQLNLFFGQTMADAALTWQEVTGKISLATKEIKEWEVWHGKHLETFEELLVVWGQGGIELADLLAEVQLAPGELQKLNDATDEYLFTQGVTNETIDEFRTNVEKALKAEQRMATFSPELARVTGNVAEAYDDAGEEIDEATKALQEQEDQMRGMVDPAFKLINASKTLAEKQLAVSDAVAEFGENSPEAIAAYEELAEAGIDFKVAQQGYINQGPSYRGELSKQLTALGLTRSAIDNIIGRLEILETIKIGDKTFNVNVRGNVGMGSGGLGFAQGGIVPGPVGQPQLAVVHGGEEVRTPNQQRGTDAQVVNNYYITAGLGASARDIKKIVEMLQQQQRWNGSLPFNTRD